MKTEKIECGKIYEVTVGKNATSVKVVTIKRRVNGQLAFECINVKSDKPIVITEAKRFVREIKPSKSILQTVGEAVGSILPKGKKAKAETATANETPTEEPKKERAKAVRDNGTVSGIDGAFLVLKDAGEALNIKQIMERINERGLCNLKGLTPSASISSAIQRDILKRGPESRFVKAGKGLFAAR